MASGITVQAVIDIDLEEVILKMAEKEKRSFSNMVAVLLEEAVEKRLSKKQKQTA